jgi:hypothetical protein
LRTLALRRAPGQPSAPDSLFPGAGATGEAAADRPARSVAAQGTASDLLLTLYGRVPKDSLGLDGEQAVLTELRVWQPSG